jgi:cellulose synthase/poly-beta-1,6-N-acetylglucosamine synthase-like glycosyltransferase
MNFITLYALIVAALIGVWLVLVILVGARMRRARGVPAMQGSWPVVSVIVAAMNEELTIEPAMRSLLELDYPMFEVIAVDDRSTDATGALLDRMSAEYRERLRVLHIEELPDGWLGKCNALETASRTARGEWLLFTDADVVFAPTALRTAVAFATANRADHIVLFPRMLWEGFPEAALLSFFTMAFTIGFQMWRIESRSKRAFVGVGAFNMVRRDIYERFGGHEPLRLEVADDVKLGYLVKKHGGRSMAVDSEGEVTVRWRQGVRDTMRGLERSGFAGLDFNWMKLLASVLFCFCVMLAPYVLPFLSGSTAVLWLSASSIVAIIMLYAFNARRNGFPLWIGLLHPIACVLFAYAFLRSAVVTTARGGLSWRGTFYSIEELKKGTVR